MAWGEIQTSQVMVAVLFGTNLLLFLVFKYVTHVDGRDSRLLMPSDKGQNMADEGSGVELLERGTGVDATLTNTTAPADNQVVAKPAIATATKHTKPFTGSLECWSTLTAEMLRISVLMAFTYICERHWFFEHSGKEYVYICIYIPLPLPFPLSPLP